MSRVAAASEAQMRAGRLEAKSRANWRYDRGAACCNNMPCASNGPSRVYTRALLSSRYQGRVSLSPALHYASPPPAPDYSPLSTCKRRISTRLPTDPRPHLPPVNRFPSPPANLWIAPPLRYHLSKDSTILPGYNVAVREDTTAVGREREGLVYGRPRYTRGRR